MRQRIPLPIAPRPSKAPYKPDETLPATPQEAAKVVADAKEWLRSLMAYCCAKEHEDPAVSGVTNATCGVRGINMLCAHQLDQDVEGKVLMADRFKHLIVLACTLKTMTSDEANALFREYADVNERLNKLDDVAAGGYLHFDNRDQAVGSTAATLVRQFRRDILPLLGDKATRDGFREYIMSREEAYAGPMEHIRDRLLQALEGYDPEKAFADRKPKNRLPAPTAVQTRTWYASLVERVRKIWPN